MKKGFTLIETLTAIGVVAVVSCIGFGVYLNLQPDLELNTQARNLVSDLRYAQQLAVTEQVIYQVIFSPEQKKYQLINSNTGQVLKNVVLNPKITLAAISDLTANIASFNPNGAATESGQITLANAIGKTAYIEIKPSGYVRWHN